MSAVHVLLLRVDLLVLLLTSYILHMTRMLLVTMLSLDILLMLIDGTRWNKRIVGHVGMVMVMHVFSAFFTVYSAPL